MYMGTDACWSYWGDEIVMYYNMESLCCIPETNITYMEVCTSNSLYIFGLWIFIRRIDAEAEAPIVCPPDAKNWLTGKDPEAQKDWREEEKGMTKDEMVGWHHCHPGWTWIWANSGSWWWTGKPGMLQSMGSQSQTGLNDCSEFQLMSEVWYVSICV